MNEYQFLEDLFRSVLKLSRAVEGRFFVCPHMGSEIDADQLSKVIEQVNLPKKYPLVLMMPPFSRNEIYSIILFFLDKPYGEGNEISPFTRTSMTEIEQIWGNMQILATDFHQALNRIQRSVPEVLDRFVMPVMARRITPITEVGVDIASGVRMDFDVKIPQNDCIITDYNNQDLNAFIL